MEPAKIDWKNLEWRFVEDKAYEQINAPKWFDFLNPNDNLLDDHTFFCTPECNHPKTAEDFLRSSPYKVRSPSDVSGVSPLGDKAQRDLKLKRRGLTNSSVHPTNNSRFKEDGENQNPNLSTPPNYQAKVLKEAIKSSAEKKQQPVETAPHNNEVLPKLKSTLSARNLFAGKDILNQITDFCSELKRLAMRAKEREEVESGMVNNKEEEVNKVESSGEVLSEFNGRERERMPLLDLSKGKSEKMVKKEFTVEVLGEVNGKQRERMPMLDANQGKIDGSERTILKEGKRIKKRVDNAENIPVSLNLEVKRKGGEDSLQIRTNPPSPQCFSAARPPTSKITPSKASKSRLMEKGGILQGQTNIQVLAVDDSKQVITKDDYTEKAKSVCIADGKEARTALDVFWFLKPCTLST